MHRTQIKEVQLVRPPQALGGPECLLVRLVTERGEWGLGEVGGGFEDDCADAVDWLADAALGRAACDREAVWQRLASEAEGWDGDEWLLAAAASGIDTAMWDLAGKVLGVPAAVLMGGRVRARTEVCADCGELASPEAMRAAAALLAAGVRTFSFTVDGKSAGLRDALRDMRRALGVDPLVVLEVQRGPDGVDAAVALGGVLDQAEPYWVEGLLPDGQWSELARVRSAVNSPTAAGGTVVGVRKFWRALESQCADVVKPRLSLCDGPTGALRVADAVEMRGLRMALRAGESPVSALAGAAVCSARVGVSPLQLPAPALQRLMAARPELVQDGFMLPREEPGLGAGGVAEDEYEVLVTFTQE